MYQRTQNSTTSQVFLTQVPLSHAVGSFNKSSLYTLLQNIGYFLPKAFYASISFLTTAYISTNPLRLRSQIQLPSPKCKGNRKEYLQIALAHNPTIQFTERLRKDYLKLLAYFYEPSNALFHPHRRTDSTNRSGHDDPGVAIKMLNSHMSAAMTAQLPKVKRRNTVKRYVNANFDKLLSRLSFESDKMEVAEDSRLNPFIICFSNRGQLAYTSCCSQPMHIDCRMSTVISCPHCRAVSFELKSFHPTTAELLTKDWTLKLKQL